jgi:hypothetical protein
MSNEEQSRESLIIHIEGLQAVLAKRNLRIAELEAKLASPELINNVAVGRAYRQGFKDCASKMMDATKDTALLLRQIRKDAFELYLVGDGNE